MNGHGSREQPTPYLFHFRLSLRRSRRSGQDETDLLRYHLQRYALPNHLAEGLAAKLFLKDNRFSSSRRLRSDSISSHAWALAIAEATWVGDHPQPIEISGHQSLIG